MKRLWTLLTCLGLFASIQAQNGAKITGQILAEDGTPTSFATVMLQSAADSTMVKASGSDDQGKYVFVGVPDGDYFVQVTYVGYADGISDIFTYQGSGIYQVPNIIMREASEQLDEVVVTSSRPLVEVHPDKTVFNVDGSINATGNTALELLRKSPGVVVDNNDNIILAGKNGVQIYIDGKRSPLSADDLANYLKTMQSSEIDNIEIITNPSAKYDAEGNAGIINIRLKKDKSLGTNGSVNLGYRYGETAKYNASTNLNYRNKKVNVFGNYGFFDGGNDNGFKLYREQGGRAFDQRNFMTNENTSHNFKLGTDISLDQRSTLGFLVSGNINDNQNDGTSVTDIFSLPDMTPEEILDASSIRDGERNNLNANINYMFRSDNGNTWNVDLDYGRFRNDGSTYQPNTYFNADRSEVLSSLIFSIQTPTDINIYTAKFDREATMLGGKVGFGAKVSFVETDNTFNFFDIVDDQRILNTDRSNNFVFEENINAAYASYQRQLGEKWNMMLGLRVENTHSTGTLTAFDPANNNVVDRNYTDLFPSGGLTFQINEKNSLRLNYSRRIDRPSYQDLNPFEFKLDELTFQQGNAFLNPQYSNSYSLTHTFNYRLNTSLSYTRTNDVFTQITQALDENTSVLKYVNLATQKNLALTVSYPFSVANWWNVYANVTGYQLRNEAVIDGDEIDLTANVFSFYAQNTWNLPKDFKLELSGWYNSPALWQGNWTTNSMYSVDVGVQKRLLNDRANLKVTFTDVFGSQRWSGESTFGDLYIRGRGWWESQQLRVNFSYSFGNQQVKASRRRATGLEDEQSRIKTDND
ncbi:MAG: TonB-dependent receptor [Saprospiraceae bacterium]|nr:TonB-dependent receptor [Saprospiraceae bacterium]